MVVWIRVVHFSKTSLLLLLFSPWKETQPGKEPCCVAFIPGLIQEKTPVGEHPPETPTGFYTREPTKRCFGVYSWTPKKRARMQSWECCAGLVGLEFLVVLVRFTLPKTKNMPLKIGFPKRIQDRFPTIHFQGLLLKLEEIRRTSWVGVVDIPLFAGILHIQTVVVWDSWTINYVW